MPYISVNGLTLFYEISGNDKYPSILFISGLGGDHRAWTKIISYLEYPYSIITFDNRDACMSERSNQPYTIKDMADDVAELLHSLDVNKTHIVGYSMGGAIAQEIAISYPNLVDKLILLSTYTSGDPRGDVIFGSLASVRSKVSTEEFLRLSLPWSFSVDEFKIPGFIESLIKDNSLDEHRQEYSAYERQMKATISFESSGRLGNIHAPTLMIFGDADILTPMRFALELVEGIKSSNLIILEKSGHGIVLTRARDIAWEIDKFLLT